MSDIIIWKVIWAMDSNENPKAVACNANWDLNVNLTSWINETTDSLKVESNGQNYYDLLPNDMVMALNTWVTIWAWSNYDLSATGGWIIHPDIKRAKAIMIYSKLSQATEVKLVVCPYDTPDNNTPEFYYRGNGETEYMYQDKTGAPFTPNYPSCTRILPISTNALKIYLKTTTWWANTISDIHIRLIF